MIESVFQDKRHCTAPERVFNQHTLSYTIANQLHNRYSYAKYRLLRQYLSLFEHCIAIQPDGLYIVDLKTTVG